MDESRSLLAAKLPNYGNTRSDLPSQKSETEQTSEERIAFFNSLVLGSRLGISHKGYLALKQQSQQLKDTIQRLPRTSSTSAVLTMLRWSEHLAACAWNMEFFIAAEVRHLAIELVTVAQNGFEKDLKDTQRMVRLLEMERACIEAKKSLV